MTIDSSDIRTIKRLTRKAQRGDEHAFESLAHAFSASLYRVAASCLSGNEADIADALQDTLIAAWNNIHTLRQPRYFKTWLIRICINSCRQIQRRQHTHVPLEDINEEQLATLEESCHNNEAFCLDGSTDANTSFKQLVAAAGDSCALAITLYYGEGYTTTEIADLLNLTTDGVRQQLSRGRKRIKCFLDKNERRDRPQDFAAHSPIQKNKIRPRAPTESDSSLRQAANPT